MLHASDVELLANSWVSGQLPVHGETGDALTFRLLDGPTHGELTLNQSTGSFVYRPAVNYSGSDTFTVQIRDDQGTVISKEINLAIYSLVAVETATLAAPAADGEVLAAADFDGDGDIDILWKPTSGNVLLLEADGGHFVTHALAAAPSAGTPLTGDFNNDGKLDVLWTNASGGGSMWQLDGASIIKHSPINSSSGAQIVGVADFNHDGKDDLVWLNSSRQIWVWYMDGNALVGGDMVGRLGAGGTGIVRVGDYTEDGKPDLLVSTTTGEWLWTLDGLSVTSKEAYGPPASAGTQFLRFTLSEDEWFVGTVAPHGTDAVSYALASDPTHGTVELDIGTGAFVYRPTADYTGEDWFDILVTTAGDARTASIALSITSGSGFDLL